MKINKSKKIKIKPSTPSNGSKRYELYIDGQLVYEHGYFSGGTIYFDGGSDMTVKKDLNFDASHFLDDLFLHIENPEGNWSKRLMWDIFREKDEITISYFIVFNEDEKWNGIKRCCQQKVATNQMLKNRTRMTRI